jgi:hypothetical protein
MSANGARGRGLSAQPRIRDAQPALSRTSFVGCHRGRPPVSLWGHPAPPPRTSPAGIFLSSAFSGSSNHASNDFLDRQGQMFCSSSLRRELAVLGAGWSVYHWRGMTWHDVIVYWSILTKTG